MQTRHLDSLQCLSLLQRHCPMTTVIRSLLQNFQEVRSLCRMSQVKVHRRLTRFSFSKSFSPSVGTRGFQSKAYWVHTMWRGLRGYFPTDWVYAQMERPDQASSQQYMQDLYIWLIIIQIMWQLKSCKKISTTTIRAAPRFESSGNKSIQRRNDKKFSTQTKSDLIDFQRVLSSINCRLQTMIRCRLSQ